MRRALSRAAGALVAAWVESFLKYSGTALLHGQGLLPVVIKWLGGLDGADFVQLLPLVRRPFAMMPSGEHRMIGEALRSPGGGNCAGLLFDKARAAKAMPDPPTPPRTCT